MKRYLKGFSPLPFDPYQMGSDRYLKMSFWKNLKQFANYSEGELNYLVSIGELTYDEARAIFNLPETVEDAVRSGTFDPISEGFSQPVKKFKASTKDFAGKYLSEEKEYDYAHEKVPKKVSGSKRQKGDQKGKGPAKQPKITEKFGAKRTRNNRGEFERGKKVFKGDAGQSSSLLGNNSGNIGNSSVSATISAQDPEGTGNMARGYRSRRRGRRGKRRAHRKRKGFYNPKFMKAKRYIKCTQERDVAMRIDFDANGDPSNQLSNDGGVLAHNLRINNLFNPWGLAGAWTSYSDLGPDGFDRIETYYNKAYVWKARVSYAFDMRNCGGCKLYLSQSADTFQNDHEAYAPYTPATTAAEAGSNRDALMKRLEEGLTKSQRTFTILDKGDEITHSKLTLTYRPKIVDKDRGKVIDDDNDAYANTCSNNGLTTPAGPANSDYVNFVLLPYSDAYNKAFMANQTALVWGKVYITWYVCLVSDENQNIQHDVDVSGAPEVFNEIEYVQ